MVGSWGHEARQVSKTKHQSESDGFLSVGKVSVLISNVQ